MAEDNDSEGTPPPRTIEGAARAATEDAPATGPARRRPRRSRHLALMALGAGVGAVAVVFAILAALTLSGAVSSLIGLGDLRDELAAARADSAGNRAAVADLARRNQTALSDLTARMEKLAEADSAGDTADAALGDRLTALSGRIDALTGDEDALKEDLAALRTAMADLKAAGASPAAAAPDAAVRRKLFDLETAASTREARLADLSKEVTGLGARLDALDQRLSAEEGRAAASARAGLAERLDALESAARAGRPFAGALDAVTAALPDSAELAALRPFAAAPPPDADMLARQLAAIDAAPESQAAGEAAPPQSGLWGRLSAWAGGLVTVRRAGEATWRAARAGAAARLAAGDVAGAVALVESAAPEAAAAWLQQARDRIALDTALDRLAAAGTGRDG